MEGQGYLTSNATVGSWLSERQYDDDADAGERDGENDADDDDDDEGDEDITQW